MLDYPSLIDIISTCKGTYLGIQVWIERVLQQEQMRYLLPFIICIVVVKAVPQLSADQFFQELANNEFLFVKFYSPECGHCITMEPEYQLLYKHSEGKKYKVVKFDCIDNRDICETLGIQGNPSLQLFVSGTPFLYSGPRTADAIIKWVQDLHTSTLPALSEQQGNKKIGKETFAVVSGLSKKTQRLIAIASKVHDTGVKFYSFLLRGFIGLYKKGLNKPLRYETDQHFPMSLINWVFENGRSAITRLEKEEILQYLKRQNKFKYVLGIVDDGEEWIGSSLAVVGEWCSNNFEQILCLSINKDSPLFEKVKEQLKAKKSTIVIIRSDLSIGYHFPHSTVTSQNLSQFYEDAKGDKIYRDIDVERDLLEQIEKIEPSNVQQPSSKIEPSNVEPSLNEEL